MSLRSRMERLALRGLLGLPTGGRRRLFGAPPMNARGVRVDEDIHVMLALEARLKSGFAGGTPQQARAGLQHSVQVVEGPLVELDVVEELEVAGLPCRRYARDRRERPRLVYLHGGGWVVGDLRSHDRFCRRLAAHGGVEVIAVDYPLAPEHPFPAAIEAVVAVWRALAAEPGLLALGGDSAGGNLSVAVSVALREAGLRMPDHLVLIYPSTELEGRSASRTEFAEGFLLTKASIDWYRAQYAATDLGNPLANPSIASLEGFPGAIVATAGFDPLRDEGEKLAMGLRAAGASVNHLDEADLVHGYLQMDGVIPAADRAVSGLTAAVAAWVAIASG
jgi:acetyl esterase